MDPEPTKIVANAVGTILRANAPISELIVQSTRKGERQAARKYKKPSK